MSLCAGCGTQNIEGARFCVRWGATLPDATVAAPWSGRGEQGRPFDDPLRHVPAASPPPQYAPPPPVYAPPPVFGVQPAIAAFRCPYCGSSSLPAMRQRISAAGWIVFAVLLLTCLPLCIIGVFIKEDYRVCSSCGLTLN